MSPRLARGGRLTPKSPEAIEGMRASGRVLAEALRAVEAMVTPGVTTSALNELADTLIRDRGGIPSFLGVPSGVPDIPPFPASICTSVNDVIVHGIPSGAPLHEGDIIGVDCGVVLDGWHSDSAVTMPVGEVSPEAARLIAVTRHALAEGIRAAQVGRCLGDIGAAVQRCVEAAGFAVVRRLVGHGIGQAMHEPPQVPNFGRRDTGPRLVPGVTLAIEPMVNALGPEVAFDADGWTARTADRSLSAHCEHTIAVTAGGPVILTAV